MPRKSHSDQNELAKGRFMAVGALLPSEDGNLPPTHEFYRCQHSAGVKILMGMLFSEKVER
jgi:hypothetical protein